VAKKLDILGRRKYVCGKCCPPCEIKMVGEPLRCVKSAGCGVPMEARWRSK
jgi:hypothetical protein